MRAALGAIAVGACLLGAPAAVRAAEPLIYADTERNFRRSLAKVSRAVGPEKTAELEQALVGLVRVRAARNRLEQSSRLSSGAPGMIGPQKLKTDPQAEGQDLASLVATWLGRRVDGRTPTEILALWERERTSLDDAAVEMTGRLRIFEEALLAPRIVAAPPPARELLNGAVSIVSLSGSVNDTQELRGAISFLIENRHHRAIRSIVLAPAGEQSGECGSFEYAPALPLRPGATQRVITQASSRDARCASRLQLAGYRDDANEQFGAGAPPRVVDEAETRAWFYRTSAFAENLRSISILETN